AARPTCAARAAGERALPGDSLLDAALVARAEGVVAPAGAAAVRGVVDQISLGVAERRRTGHGGRARRGRHPDASSAAFRAALQHPVPFALHEKAVAERILRGAALHDRPGRGSAAAAPCPDHPEARELEAARGVPLEAAFLVDLEAALVAGREVAQQDVRLVPRTTKAVRPPSMTETSCTRLRSLSTLTPSLAVKSTDTPSTTWRPVPSRCRPTRQPRTVPLRSTARAVELHARGRDDAVAVAIDAVDREPFRSTTAGPFTTSSAS